KNGANGNQTLTVAAGATGIVEDPINTDAFAPTDNLNFISSGGTAGQIIPEWGFLTLAPFTPILAAATGSFSLAGQAATFQVIEGAATGSFAFTGVAASFKIVETAATGAFALTGGAAAFRLSGSVAPGAFALTGNSAFF